LSRQRQETEAYLLRSVDYRDADRILTLLTRDHGRVSALARSARRSRKRFGGSLEPFHLLRVGIRFGRGDLATLEDSTVVRDFPGVLKKLDRIRAAGRAFELLRKLLPESASEDRVFDAATRFLEVLAESDDPEQVELELLARTLALVGFAPELEVCAISGVRCPEGQAALFDPERGGIVSRAHGGGPFLLGGRARALLAAAMRGELGNEWSSQAHQQAREALDAHLGAHVRV